MSTSLREARKDRGITLQAVADALHMSRQTYAKLEENPEKMTIKQAVDACGFIGVDIDDVFLPDVSGNLWT